MDYQSMIRRILDYWKWGVYWECLGDSCHNKSKEGEGDPGQRCGTLCYSFPTSGVWSSQVPESRSDGRFPTWKPLNWRTAVGRTATPKNTEKLHTCRLWRSMIFTILETTSILQKCTVRIQTMTNICGMENSIFPPNFVCLRSHNYMLVYSPYMIYVYTHIPVSKLPSGNYQEWPNL